MWEIFESLCNKRGVTFYKVSKETGISTSTLTNWKKGRYTPKADKIKAIADFFEVSVEYLMGESDNVQKGKDDASIVMDKELMDAARKIQSLPKDKRDYLLMMIKNFPV